MGAENKEIERVFELMSPFSVTFSYEDINGITLNYVSGRVAPRKNTESNRFFPGNDSLLCPIGHGYKKCLKKKSNRFFAVFMPE